MKRSTIVALLFFVWTVPVTAGSAGETVILPPELPWDGKSRGLALHEDHAWATPCERSALTRSPHYAETMGWLRKLVDEAPELSMLSLGKSAEGRDTPDIAATLYLSYATVRNHVQHILVKLGVHSIPEAVACHILTTD